MRTATNTYLYIQDPSNLEREGGGEREREGLSACATAFCLYLSASHHFSTSHPREACRHGPSPCSEPFGHEACPKPLSHPLEKHLRPTKGGPECAETHRMLVGGHGDISLGIVLPAVGSNCNFYDAPNEALIDDGPCLFTITFFTVFLFCTFLDPLPLTLQ